MADSAKDVRRSQIRESKDAINRINKMAKEKAEAEREAVLEAHKKDTERMVAEYWENHTEEKAQLDSEKSALAKELESLEAVREQFEKRKKQIDEKRKESVPSDPEVQELKKKLSNLLEQLNATGIFQFKIKQSLNEEIDEIRSKLEKATSKHKAERNDHISKIDQEIAAINNEASPTKARIAEIKSRLAEIDARFKNAGTTYADRNNLPIPKSFRALNYTLENEGFDDYIDTIDLDSVNDVLAWVDTFYESIVDPDFDENEFHSVVFIDNERKTELQICHAHEGKLYLMASFDGASRRSIHEGTEEEFLYRLVSDYIDGERNFPYVDWGNA